MLVLRGTTLYYKVRIWHYKILLCTIRVLVCTMGADVGASRALPTGSVQKTIFCIKTCIGQIWIWRETNVHELSAQSQRYCKRAPAILPNQSKSCCSGVARFEFPAILECCEGILLEISVRKRWNMISYFVLQSNI